MKVREATIEDLAVIQDLSLELFRDPSSSSDKYSDDKWAHDEQGTQYFTNAIQKDGQLCLVAEDNGKVVGYLTGEPNEVVDWRPIKTSELGSFYIAPEYRSQGVGAEMVEEFARWSKAQGAVTARVSAYVANQRGIDFYKKVGFAPESVELEMELE